MHSFIIETSTYNSQDENLISLIKKQIGSEFPHHLFKAHPDIHHLYPEQKTVSKKISIEAVRQFQEVFTNYPFQLKFHLGIIWEAESLTTEAQQALLKLLEEPGENVYLFLITKSSSNLLPTIKSRCAVIKTKEVVTEYYSVTTDQQTDLVDLITQLNQSTLGQRLQLLEPYSKNRLEALTIIEQLIHITRSNYSNPTIHPSPNSSSFPLSTIHFPLDPSLLKILTVTYNDLTANVGVKLVLDQLALNWPT